MNGFGIHYKNEENESILGQFKEGALEQEFSRCKGRPDS